MKSNAQGAPLQQLKQLTVPVYTQKVPFQKDTTNEREKGRISITNYKPNQT